MDLYFLFPNEILLYIFSFLTSKELLLKIQLINKFWCGISKDNFLWKHFCEKSYYQIKININSQEKRLDYELYEYRHRYNSILIFDQEILMKYENKISEINYMEFYKKFTDIVHIGVMHQLCKWDPLPLEFYHMYVDIPRQFNCNKFCEQLQNLLDKTRNRELIEFTFGKNMDVIFSKNSTEIINFGSTKNVILSFFDHKINKKLRIKRKIILSLSLK